MRTVGDGAIRMFIIRQLQKLNGELHKNKRIIKQADGRVMMKDTFENVW